LKNDMEKKKIAKMEGRGRERRRKGGRQGKN
jgi:hypothetical protein